MELRELRSFVAVAEELHFGRAAARLHISPPPLTQRIKKLEESVGASLFRRTKRTVALTDAGFALLEEARRLLVYADALPATVQRANRGERGHIRVGVVGSAIFSRARQIQISVAAELPGIRLVWHELNTREQIELIQQGRLDLALINTPIDHPGISCADAVREPMVIALPAAHPMAKHASVPLRALRNEVFILGARHLSPGLYDRMVAACGKAGFAPNIDHQANHMFTYLSLVAIGAGISLVPASMAKAGMAGVAFVRIRGSAPYSEVSIAWNPANPSAVLARVLTFIRGSMQRRARQLVRSRGS